MEKKFLIPALGSEPNIEKAMEAFLREKISSGAFPEGLRLPNTLQWAKALRVNDRHVHRVLARLAAQGFLCRRPRLGTYVQRRTEPATVVILTGDSLIVERMHGERKIVELIADELRQLGYRTAIFDDLFSLLINDYREQQNRVALLRERLASLNPAGYVESGFELNRLPDLYPKWKRPLVSLYPTGSGGDVYTDQRSSIRESLRYLASRGRTKVLFVRHEGRRPIIHWSTDTFWDALNEFGFVRGMLRELYFNSSSGSSAEAAHRWMLQIIESWQGERKNYVPDSLLVSDDVMMLGIATALSQAGVRVPEDLLVVTQASEAIHHHYAVPVVRCEVPLRELAHHLVQLLDARICRNGEIKTPILIKETRIVEWNPFRREPAEG